MNVLRKALLFVAIAALSNLSAVLVLPRAINALVLHQIAARVGDNTALLAPRPDASARKIVRPSPDLLYTACAFDVSGHPLHVTGPLPEGYASVSGFASDTRNFFSVNDRQVQRLADGSRRFDIVIATAVVPLADPSAQLVIAPSSRGLVLFRTLIPRDADLPALLDIQAAQRCEPLAR